MITMPLKMQAFLDQATYNKSLLNTLDEKFPDDFSDWKIAIAFCTILHDMNACLAADRRSITVRDQRDRICHLNPDSAECVYPLSDENWDKCYEMYIKIPNCSI
jgi:hypothetical protein